MQAPTAPAPRPRSSFDAGFYAPPEKDQSAAGDKGGAFAASLITNISAQVDGKTTDLLNIGGAIVDNIHTGFQNVLGTYEWSQPLLTAIAGPVAAIVFEMLEDRNSKQHETPQQHPGRLVIVDQLLLGH